MKLCFLGGLLCVLLLQCTANPIVTITADHDSRSLEKSVDEKEVEAKGELQEETTGVFKSEASETTSQQSDQKDDSNSVNDQQPVSVSTETNEVSTAVTEQKTPESSAPAKPKAKKGKVRP